MKPRHIHRRPQRGVALLIALVLVALVATVAAGMVWQQSRAVRVEAAARAQAQAGWVLAGALDFSRQILREDMRSGTVDHLGETWAAPVAETRLSSFLAADADNNASSDLPEVFLAGGIADAQSRYNLRNLVDNNGELVEVEVLGLQRLFDAVGLPAAAAVQLARKLQVAWSPAAAGEAGGSSDAPRIPPASIDQLVWLGLDPALVARLEPWLVLLPLQTPVNVNTAPREVLLAAVKDIDPGSAERLVQVRSRKPFLSFDEVKRELPDTLQDNVVQTRLDVKSNWFFVDGRLRTEERVLAEHSLVHRVGTGRAGTVVTVLRERRSSVVPP